MKFLPSLVPFLVLLASPLLADSNADIDAVRQLDDARIAANKAGDRSRLSEIYSDELRYAHSSGVVMNKTELVESVTHTSYSLIEFEDRAFKEAAPGVVLVTGHLHLKEVAEGKGPQELHLSFLGVYRNENGAWKFLAWQSCKMPVAPAP